MPLTNDQKIKIEHNRIKAIQKRDNLIELRKKKLVTNVHTNKESFRPITMTSHKIKGDLIKLAIKGDFDVIIHGCNCFCTMGAGIAKSIKAAFPEAYKADMETLKGDKEKLGNFSAANIKRNGQEITIVNAYTQYHYGGTGIKVDYSAIQVVNNTYNFCYFYNWGGGVLFMPKDLNHEFTYNVYFCRVCFEKCKEPTLAKE